MAHYLLSSSSKRIAELNFRNDQITAGQIPHFVKIVSETAAFPTAFAVLHIRG